MAGLKFSLYKIGGTFSNGLSHGMVDFGSKKFPDTIVTMLTKVCSCHKDKIVVLAEYDTPDRADAVREEIIRAYKEQKDYYLPEE